MNEQCTGQPCVLVGSIVQGLHIIGINSFNFKGVKGNELRCLANKYRCNKFVCCGVGRAKNLIEIRSTRLLPKIRGHDTGY